MKTKVGTNVSVRVCVCVCPWVWMCVYARMWHHLRLVRTASKPSSSSHCITVTNSNAVRHARFDLESSVLVDCLPNGHGWSTTHSSHVLLLLTSAVLGGTQCLPAWLCPNFLKHLAPADNLLICSGAVQLPKDCCCCWKIPYFLVCFIFLWADPQEPGQHERRVSM